MNVTISIVMLNHGFRIIVLGLSLTLYAQNPNVWRDPSPHRSQFVTVEPNVQLEVLDWGGSGRPLILLTGGGGTAHSFDDFAPELISIGHVYGITRRGSGASSAPASGYGADRLGDDVLAVMESLNIRKPVLVGESVGGEELSSVGSRHPDRISGLIYLEAAYQYAFDNGKGATIAEMLKINLAQQIPVPAESDRANFKALQAWYRRALGVTVPEAELRQIFNTAPDGSVGAPRTPPGYTDALLAGMQKYTDLRAPVLAIFAIPADLGPWMNRDDAKTRDALDAYLALAEKQAKAFEMGVPTARVVRLAHAKHMIFESNEADVLREMGAFLSSLR